MKRWFISYAFKRRNSVDTMIHYGCSTLEASDPISAFKELEKPCPDRYFVLISWVELAPGMPDIDREI